MKSNLMKWFKKNRLYFIGAPIGALLGFLYWREIGCNSGSCAITSSPLNSTLYGAIMGALFLSFFEKKQVAKDKQKHK